MSVVMKLDNWPKFVFALIVSTQITVLMITKTVTSDVGVPFLTAVAGYILGNGVRAARDEQEQAMFYGRRERDPV